MYSCAILTVTSKYNYFLIACKYMQLPTNHIARPMTLYSYP